MSFGYRDEDWVDPPDPVFVKCEACEWWRECDCGCGWGYCTDRGQSTKADDGCEFDR